MFKRMNEKCTTDQDNGTAERQQKTFASFDLDQMKQRLIAVWSGVQQTVGLLSMRQYDEQKSF